LRILLDTHVLLWWFGDDPALGEPARAAISDGATRAFVSAASVWEIAIKRDLGKLEAPGDLLEQLDAGRFATVDLTAADLWLAGHLPRHHADPFDRALIAQALRGGLRVVTRDERFAAYGVDVLPA
jgi:PIN domain nuclease of toxin-antitoxin system